MDMQKFLSQHELPDNYIKTAQQWFLPLCERIIEHHNRSSQPFIVGISGCQGSGKTTLSSYIAEYLASVHDKKVVSLSIDDFYLNQDERLALAKNIHPLLKTRGVPGTHDITLAIETFDRLQNGAYTLIPRFNKASDNPYPTDKWPTINYRPDVILLEGWCVNLTPQPVEALAEAVNELEKEHDARRIWRAYVNKQLSQDYQTLFDMVDYKVFLKAPSFDCVFKWRVEQEHKLANTNTKDKAVMTDEQIAIFIQHYQRLTEHALKTLPNQSDTVFFLDESRTITNQKVVK